MVSYAFAPHLHTQLLPRLNILVLGLEEPPSCYVWVGKLGKKRIGVMNRPAYLTSTVFIFCYVHTVMNWVVMVGLLAYTR